MWGKWFQQRRISGSQKSGQEHRLKWSEHGGNGQDTDGIYCVLASLACLEGLAIWPTKWGCWRNEMSTHHPHKLSAQWAAHDKGIKMSTVFTYFLINTGSVPDKLKALRLPKSGGNWGPELSNDSFGETRQISSGMWVTLSRTESKATDVLRSTCSSPCKGLALPEITRLCKTVADEDGDPDGQWLS